MRKGTEIHQASGNVSNIYIIYLIIHPINRYPHRPNTV